MDRTLVLFKWVVVGAAQDWLLIYGVGKWIILLVNRINSPRVITLSNSSAAGENDVFYDRQECIQESQISSCFCGARICQMEFGKCTKCSYCRFHQMHVKVWPSFLCVWRRLLLKMKLCTHMHSNSSRGRVECNNCSGRSLAGNNYYDCGNFDVVR